MTITLYILGTDSMFVDTIKKNNAELITRIQFTTANIKHTSGRVVNSCAMNMITYKNDILCKFLLAEKDSAEIRNIMANKVYIKLLEHLSFPDKFIIRADNHSSINNDRYIMEAVDFVFMLEKFMDSTFIDNGGDFEQLIGEEVLVPFF